MRSKVVKFGSWWVTAETLVFYLKIFCLHTFWCTIYKFKNFDIIHKEQIFNIVFSRLLKICQFECFFLLVHCLGKKICTWISLSSICWNQMPEFIFHLKRKLWILQHSMTSVVEVLIDIANITWLYWGIFFPHLWWRKALKKSQGKKTITEFICKYKMWLLWKFISTWDSATLHSSWLELILVLHGWVHRIQLISQVKLCDSKPGVCVLSMVEEPDLSLSLYHLIVWLSVIVN